MARKANGQRLVYILSFILVILLVGEFMTGTLTNLYVKLPQHAGEMEILRGSAIVSSHVVLGLLIALGALGVVIVSIVAKKALLIVLSTLGLAGILLAMMNGFYFLTTQDDSASFSMAMGFAFSTLVYVIQVFLLGAL